MKHTMLIMALIGILLFGCIGQDTGTNTGTGSNTGTSGGPTTGSANYQNCASQCASGNAGSGAYCTDGCRLEEATRTKNTYWCDQLDKSNNIPACYGTVAKTTSDITLCDKFSGTERSHCIAAFGSSSTG
jgi:hypothetical protein